MDKARLRNALAAVIDSSAGLFQSCVARSETLPEDTRETYLNHLLSRPISDLLKSHHGFEHGFLIHSVGGSWGFQADQVAARMIERARIESPDSAVDWLTKVLQTDKADGLFVTALWGISSIEATELDQGVSLVPLRDIPSSSNLDWLIQDRNHGLPAGLARPNLLGVPEVALIRRVTVEPFITNVHEDQQPRSAEPLNVYHLLDEVRNVLTAVGPSAPIQAVSWFQFDDRDLDDALFGAGRLVRHHEVMPMRYDAVSDFNCAQAVELVRGFYRLEANLRLRLSVALDRLNLAIRRQSIGDRALDVCIALEAILSDGQGENTYKVALRSALLTGLGTGARAAVGATYTLRSALVHDGVAPPMVKVAGKSKTRSEEVVAEAIRVCADVIDAVIRRGELPDWYEYEINMTVTPEVDA
jgi:hypothetical protein